MRRDFEIVGTKSGIIEADDNAVDSIANKVYLSLTIRLGSWWFNKEFGHRLGEIKKITNDTEAKVDEYIRLALDWLLIAGRITEIVTEIEPDKINNRIVWRVRVTPAEGAEITFDDFVIVL